MAFSALALGLGTAASIAGTIISYSAQSKMAAEERSASLTAENARREQMQLEASRNIRQAVRQQMYQRAAALSTATNQGAGLGTGAIGAMDQATATGNQTINDTNSATVLGNRVFDANRAFANAQYNGQVAAGFGSLISSLGGALVSNMGTIGRLGAYYTGDQSYV